MIDLSLNFTHVTKQIHAIYTGLPVIFETLFQVFQGFQGHF